MAGILVVKHGAMGDMVLATGALAALRRHHAHEHLVLLTTPAMYPLVAGARWADAIWPDPRAGLGRPQMLLDLRRRLGAAGFTRVYDLQGSTRTLWYRRLWPGPRPLWWRVAGPESGLHVRSRLERLLAAAGIGPVPPPSVAHLLPGAVAPLRPWRAHVLLVPGGAARHPAKRWPEPGWVALARALLAEGLLPILIGGADESRLTARIAAAVTGVADLAGRTDPAALALLARGARLAVGNDTGPMHLIAAAGAPVLTLFSAASDPELSAPGWPDGAWIRRSSLDDLDPAEVIDQARHLAGFRP